MMFEVPAGEFTFAPKAVVGIVGNAVHESIRGAYPRLSRRVAAALESVDPNVWVSFFTGTGIVDFALTRDRLVAAWRLRWSCSLCCSRLSDRVG